MKKVGPATAKLDLHVGPLFCLQISDLGLVLHVVYISQTTRQKVDWVEFLQSKMWTCSSFCSPKVNLAFFCINVHNVSIAEYGSTLYVKIALAVFYYNLFEVHVCENSNVIFHQILLNVTSTKIKMHVEK